jgi:hypothetical protein
MSAVISACCESMAIDDGIKWYCTLDADHEGPHEAHGAAPLPAWDRSGIVLYIDDDAIGDDGEVSA